jgi:hypothetical protein
MKCFSLGILFLAAPALIAGRDYKEELQKAIVASDIGTVKTLLKRFHTLQKEDANKLTNLSQDVVEDKSSLGRSSWETFFMWYGLGNVITGITSSAYFWNNVQSYKDMTGNPNLPDQAVKIIMGINIGVSSLLGLLGLKYWRAPYGRLAKAQEIAQAVKEASQKTAAVQA